MSFCNCMLFPYGMTVTPPERGGRVFNSPVYEYTINWARPVMDGRN